jgi:hypothetical protein
MSLQQHTWKVHPHGHLQTVTPDILTVTGTINMPAGKLPRRMTVVRVAGRDLIIFSAMALADSEMRALEEFGRPAFMIVPNDHHRMDARSWKDRYPGIQVIAPAGARAKVEKVVPVDATHGNFGDPSVILMAVPGTEEQEAALEVHRADGVTLVLNDLIGNIRNASGVSGWFLRMMGFAGDEPHIPFPVRRAVIRNRDLVRQQLLSWAELPSLRRILVSHGEVLGEQPAAALRKLAESLQVH